MPPSTSPAAGFADGVGYLAQAATLLATERRLWRYLAIPMAVTLLAGVVLYAALLALATTVVAWLTPLLPLFLTPFGLLLNLVLGLLLLWVTGILLAKFGVILGSPWYGQLAAEIERMRLPAAEIPEAPQGAAAFAQDIYLAVLYELKKTGLVLAIGLPALLLNLIPGVGQLASGAVWTALGATTLVLDFVDPALQRRRLPFRRKLALIASQAPASAGFGLPALVLAGMPIVNLLTVPLCMAAGTLYYTDRLHAGLLLAGRDGT